ncbi:chemotaxis protein MotA [Caldalkalibacillus uzonensis]|uniref:Chemotaxis protein MotA n=1 Tax=Caldalkalibacillus uzonensis TaxID=353224 RepID=A0ABU0CXG8_9BACI|nr:flagellar motor stator protein MotA [Caldalkalibacillus uzonensis]MDQ0340864.1 chemotaxis protein MotA [Caldalkalibacillus uzonensis]
MDKTSLFGIIIGIAALLLGLTAKGSPLSILLNPAAMIIILVGTVASVSIAFPFSELKKLPALFRVIFSNQKLPDIQELIPQFKDWANIARREGLLALEDHVEQIEDPFLKYGMKMVIDGQSPEFIRQMMEEDLDAMAERHAAGAQIFSQAGTYAPTLGVLGAVMGLIAALGDLDDIERLGPAIAAAFVATLLGIFTGYVLWHPMANKLKLKSQQEIQVKQVMIEGILAIQEGVSPRVIEDKLLAYVPTKKRQVNGYTVQEGEELNV